MVFSSLKKKGLLAIAAACALIALGYHASQVFRNIYPDFVTCLTYPSSNHDKTIYTGLVKVVSINSSGFVIENKSGFRIDVHSRELPQVNETVEIKGRFNRAGHIELIDIERIKHWYQHRFIMFLASGLACTIFLVKFMSKFTFKSGTFLTPKS